MSGWLSTDSRSDGQRFPQDPMSENPLAGCIGIFVAIVVTVMVIVAILVALYVWR
jgi:hypothetical protein